METGLDPVIFFKLRAFAKRRNRLLAVRGISAMVATGLAAMVCVALVDYLFVLPGWARIMLSLGAYGLAGTVLYLSYLRWVVSAADLRQLARMFESDHPELNEKVLSAVELGQPGPEEIYGSAQLRLLLQKNVAALVRRYRLKAMLPVSRIRRWPLIALCVLTACAALMLVPGLRFPQLMARALAPIANIARVSSLTIQIIQPSDPEPLIPRGDPLRIVAQLSRATDEEVLVESFAGDEEPSVIQAEPIGKQQYAATVLVARESLTYRVFAEKASTRYYTVRARRRPHVTLFHKTYRYPPYSRLKDRQLSETTGDIKALQASKVDLQIEVDQPVASAELQIRSGDKETSVELSVADPRLLTGRIGVNESGTYRVHITARETGFENKFAPNYEIVALADLLPDVRLERPSGDLVLPPDQIVRLEGLATDDLGIRSLEQFVRINRGPWQRTTLATEIGPRLAVKKNWDLLPLQLQTGDEVSTKLVATDLKGNTGESLVAHITIGSTGFNAQNLENSRLRTRVHDSLKQLAEASKQFNDQVKSLRQRVKDSPEEAGPVQSGSAKVQAAAELVRRRAERAFEAVEAAAARAESTPEARDLLLLGRMVSRLEHNNLARAIEYAGVADSGQRLTPEQLDRAAQAAGQVEGTANHALAASRSLLAHQQARDIARELSRLGENQRQMLAQAEEDALSTEPEIKQNAWRRLGRRQKAAAKEQRLAEQMLDALSQYAEYDRARQAQNLREALEKQRRRIEEASSTESTDSVVAQRANEAQDTLAEAANRLANIARSLKSKVANDRRGLAQSLAMSSNELAALKWKLEDLARNQKKFRELQARPNVPAQELDRQNEQTARASQEAELRWASAKGQLQDRAELEDAPPSAAYHFVKDTAETAEALEALHATATDPEQLEASAKALNEIEKAYRLLETGHDLQERQDLLDEMAAKERWQFADSDPLNQPLLFWDDWVRGARALPNQLKAAGLPNEIAKAVNDLLGSKPFTVVADEARQRAAGGEHKPVAEQIELLAAEMADLAEQIEPHMAEARKVIARYAPSLPDQLRAVSKLAEKLQDRTRELAEQGAQETSGQRPAEAAGALAQQRRLNEHLDTIRDSLRRDANAQDLATPEGRQRARDADDAAAMLARPPAEAERFLEQAVASAGPQSRQNALEQAAAQQQKLNEALDLITEHYENLAAGNPEPTRTALREAEQDQPAAAAIAGRYDRIDRLARMAETSPEELRDLLERELPLNQAMQDELRRVADSAVQQAQQNLGEMTGREASISDKLKKLAPRHDRQFPEHARIASRLDELAGQARELAKKAEDLAKDKVSNAARRSEQAGAKTRPQFEQARASLKAGAEQIPKGQVASAGELAPKVEQFARKLDQAREQLDNAADATRAAINDENRQRATQAAQMAHNVGLAAQDLSNQAKRVAAELHDLARQRDLADRQIARTTPQQQQFAERARALARQAGELASNEIPTAARTAEQAGAGAAEDFEAAARAAAQAARQMPTAADAPPAELADRVEQFAQAMDQARGNLGSALGRVNAAPAGDPAKASQAVQQTRGAQDKATDLKRQADALARDLANAERRRSQQLGYADQQQRRINEMAPEVIDQVARAAAHAQRLADPEAQALSRAAEAMQGIARNELPAAQQALERASHARTAQAPVDEAYGALAEQLENLSALEPLAAWPSAWSETDPTAAWMARALDRLEAAQMAQAAASQAREAAAQQAMNQAIQAQQAAAQQGRRAMSQAIEAQQAALAQTRAQAQAQARSRARSRNRTASMFSSDRTSADMPPETGLELPASLRLRTGDWGQLRKLSAEDLMEARKEAIAEDYREMVNTYFLVISQRAKQQD